MKTSQELLSIVDLKDTNKTEMSRYTIISPVRNEAAYIEKTIKAVISQSVLPLEWIIVDDGSTDATSAIIGKYLEKNNWIKLISRKDRGFRKAGGGVIEAFYEGYHNIKEQKYDFLVKLDGDLSFDSDYFRSCFEEFEKNPKLGITGGYVYNVVNDNLVLERNPKFHVRGATKIYRRDCWNAIGGLIISPGWDTMDEVKANMLGWKTYSIPLKVHHYRVTGSAEGAWKDALKGGKGHYIVGYHPVFLIARCIKRGLERPYLVYGIGLLLGYVMSWIKKVPRAGEKAVRKYLRKQQLNKLLFRPTIWK